MRDLGTTIEIAIRSTDMDADRVVNNAVYFMYFEQSRLAHFRRLRFFNHPWETTDAPRPFAIAATEARFLAPAAFPDVLRVITRTREVRTRSFSLAYEVTRASDGVRVAEGSSVQVWLDAHGQSTALPETIRRALLKTVVPAADGDRPVT